MEIDEDDGLPDELTGKLGECLEESDGPMGMNRAYDIDKRDPVSDVKSLIHRRQVSGDSTPVVDQLSLIAPAKQSYWVEVAQELHYQGEHYDALYVWEHASRLSPDEDSDFSFEDMGWALWNASDSGVADSYLAERAAQAFAKDKVWVAVAAINQSLGKSKEVIVEIIETALRTSGKFELDDRWHINGAVGGLHFNEPWTWEDLAFAYKFLNNLPKAFEAWAMLAREDEDKAITASIESLVYEARERGYSDNEIIPDATA